MVTIEQFISALEKEFDEVTPGSLSADTDYRNIPNWSSMHALIIVAHIDAEYDVLFKAEDLKNTKTLRDLYELVISRR